MNKLTLFVACLECESPLESEIEVNELGETVIKVEPCAVCQTVAIETQKDLEFVGGRNGTASE